MTTCDGVLEYETMAGAFRVHRDGRYRYRCAKCRNEGENDGQARSCAQTDALDFDQPSAPPARVRPSTRKAGPKSVQRGDAHVAEADNARARKPRGKAGA